MEGDNAMGKKTVKEIIEAETVLVENGIEYYEDVRLTKGHFYFSPF